MDENQELSNGAMVPGPSRPQQLTFFLPAPHSKAGKSACVTRVQPVHLKQYWKIENFPTVAKLALPGNCLRSNIFRDTALPEACWQLCLYPGGKRLENANNVSLFLKMSSTSPTREVRIKVEYRFYFLNDADQPLFSNVNVGEFHAKPPKGGHSWGLRNIPRQKVLNCVREDGTLVISCHIELIPDINRVKCYAAKEVLVTPTTPVCTGFVQRQAEALKDGAMADCELECNGHIIPVHKFILSTHSKVFSAMFSHDDVQEAKEKKVIIKDTDVESVRMMLHYMYCGEVDLESNAEGVMVLAERYQMDELKQLCEEKLCTQVDRNNIAEMLYLADLFNCSFLKTAVVDVLRINKAYVMGTQSWQMLKESNPKLMNEIMERVVLGAETTSPPPTKRQRQHFSSNRAVGDDVVLVGEPRTPLTVLPYEATIPARGGRWSHRLINRSLRRFAFKVKSTDNVRYRLRPVYGFVDARSSASIEVTRTAGPRKRDKIIVQFKEAPPNAFNAVALFREGAPFAEMIIRLKAL